MTTTINADTITGGAIITGDVSGILELQASGNTALTLNASRAFGVGGTPSYGAVGEILISQGPSAAPVWAEPPPGTAIGLVRAISINCILP